MCASLEFVENCPYMYEAITLDKGLDTLFRKSQEGFDELEIAQPDTINPEQLFHNFVNKLAQVCDSEPGGSTVTALAVVQADEGPIYVMGSNLRSLSQYQEAEAFLYDLLTVVGTKSPVVEGKSDYINKIEIKKQVLWKIIKFGAQRVNHYLKQIETSLDICIDDCDKREPDFPDLKEGLEKLRTKAKFPRDLITNVNAEQKFLADCDSLIKSLHANKDLQLEQAVKKRAKGGIITTHRDDWRALWHYCRRLLSLRQAAEIIFLAEERWPQLFKNFMIKRIRSSARIPMPIPADWDSLTAASIINNMELDTTQRSHYNSLLRELQAQLSWVDTKIQEIVANGFKPFVHAEILVHNRLQRLEAKCPNLYWNDWRYIGCSKPTCRLCAYYFDHFKEQGRDIQVRTGHHNLYIPWRLPDLPSDAESRAENQDQHRQLQKYVTERVRENIRRTLVDRRTKGKRYDSNSYSNSYTLPTRGPRSNGSSSGASTRTHHSMAAPSPPDDGRVASEVEDSEEEWVDCETGSSGGA